MLLFPLLLHGSELSLGFRVAALSLACPLHGVLFELITADTRRGTDTAQGKVDRKSRPLVPLLKKRDSGVFFLGEFVNVGKYHQFRNLDETRTCQVFQFDPKTLATF